MRTGCHSPENAIVGAPVPPHVVAGLRRRTSPPGDCAPPRPHPEGDLVVLGQLGRQLARARRRSRRSSRDRTPARAPPRRRRRARVHRRNHAVGGKRLPRRYVVRCRRGSAHPASAALRAPPRGPTQPESAKAQSVAPTDACAPIILSRRPPGCPRCSSAAARGTARARAATVMTAPAIISSLSCTCSRDKPGERHGQRVQLLSVSTISGHMKSFHVARNVRIASVTRIGLQQRHHERPEDAPLARAVDAGRLEQLIGQRQRVLAHQEDAEHARQRRHDHAAIAC